jgi:ParB-like chromosome segregation protein Spo0J
MRIVKGDAGAATVKAIDVRPERIALDDLEVNPELGYKIHPFADAFPMMEGAEFDELVEDIRKNELREAIEYIEHNGERIIIDGRNRLKACRAAGVTLARGWPDFVTVEDAFARHGIQSLYPRTDEELLAYVWSKNVHRRQLTASQRAIIATEHQAFIDAITKSSAQRRRATQGRPKKGAKKTAGKVALSKKTADIVAKTAKVSPRTMKDALAVKKSGNKKLAKQVKAGTKSVSAAAKEVRAKKAPTKSAKTPTRAEKQAAEPKPAPSSVANPDAEALLARFVDFFLRCRRDLDLTPELSACAEQLEKDLRCILQEPVAKELHGLDLANHLSATRPLTECMVIAGQLDAHVALKHDELQKKGVL